MSQYCNPNRTVKPTSLDSSPVFFTGLTKKAPIIKSEVSLCILCNGNIKDTSLGDLCSDCKEIPKEISEHISGSNYGNSPLESSNANQSRSLNASFTSSTSDQSCTSFSDSGEMTSLLPSPTLNCIFNSPLQNDLIESSIQSLLNSDIKGLLSSLQTPKLENSNFKSKSSWRERQEARSKASPYSHSPSPNQNLHPNNKNHGHLRYSPQVTNGPQRQHFNNAPSFHWSSPASISCDKLSRDMWKLYHENKQTEDVKSKKMHLRETLHGILRQQFDCALYVVGSSMTGLGAKSSDIDMCLMLTDSEIDQQKEALNILQDVRKLFYNYKFLYNIQLIPAKVPILKFYDSVSQVEVDLNINNAVGIRNTQLLLSYARIDERVAPLIILVKLWARHHKINDAKHNTLSSYSIVLMVIHFLQYRCQPPVVPCLQLLQPDKFLMNTDVRKLKLHEDLPNFISENQQDLGELFMGFLNYFANEFNFYDSVISVRLGRVIPKNVAKRNSSPKNKAGHWQCVCIEEPFDLTNTARSVFNDKIFEYIRYVFCDCWRRLMENPDMYYILS